MEQRNNTVEAGEGLLNKVERLVEKEKFKKSFRILESIELSGENFVRVEMLKILCLAGLKRYEEAIVICESILEVIFIEDVQETLIQLLRFIGRFSDAENVQERFKNEEDIEEEIGKFDEIMTEVSEQVDISIEEFKELFADKKRAKEQLVILDAMEHKDITLYFPQMKNILKAKKPNYIVKTTLLNLLKHHGITKKVVVYKAEKKISMNPSLEYDEHTEWVKCINKEVKNIIGDNEELIGKVQIFCAMLGLFAFPIIFDEYSPKSWAMASIIWLHDNKGEEYTVEVEDTYKEEILNVINIINNLVENAGEEYL